ncbi:hypothetical protein ZHAS_00018688 [Anopheles sinensis]|uniref:Uncharacterized protein n=1 Tax=Anopheles sinensis TaxID=74873 RepID=A0A084WKB0_ANOSI|nr:hypothetical protein ZHAS_00018688 [Anopheles sinensis]
MHVMESGGNELSFRAALERNRPKINYYYCAVRLCTVWVAYKRMKDVFLQRAATPSSASFCTRSCSSNLSRFERIKPLASGKLAGSGFRQMAATDR